jgi:hypothetical protein
VATALVTQTNALTEAMDKYQISAVHTAALGRPAATAKSEPRRTDLANRPTQAARRQTVGQR